MKNLKSLPKKPLLLLFLRLIIGGIFLISGMEKLTRPVEEFIVSLNAYRLLPELFVRPFALIFPWLELLAGVFLLLGLFYRFAIAFAGGILLLLTAVIGMTLLRGISLEDCGCFKSLGIRESGPEAFFRNLVLIFFWLILFLSPEEGWTTDRFLRGEADQ